MQSLTLALVSQSPMATRCTANKSKMLNQRHQGQSREGVRRRGEVKSRVGSCYEATMQRVGQKGWAWQRSINALGDWKQVWVYRDTKEGRSTRGQERDRQEKEVGRIEVCLAVKGPRRGTAT